LSNKYYYISNIRINGWMLLYYWINSEGENHLNDDESM